MSELEQLIVILQLELHALLGRFKIVIYEYISSFSFPGWTLKHPLTTPTLRE